MQVKAVEVQVMASTSVHGVAELKMMFTIVIQLVCKTVDLGGKVSRCDAAVEIFNGCMPEVSVDESGITEAWSCEVELMRAFKLLHVVREEWN